MVLDYIDPDRLWINQGLDAAGKLSFKDETANRLPYTSWFSMGTDVADVNNDGRLDFFVGDMAATTHIKAKTSMGEMLGLRKWVMENGWPRQMMRNCLFLNTGTDRWEESAFLSGLDMEREAIRLRSRWTGGFGHNQWHREDLFRLRSPGDRRHAHGKK